MATERRSPLRRAAFAALLALGALLCAALPAAAQTQVPAPSPTPLPPAEPWWIPVAFQGHAVHDVRADSGQITVSVDGLGVQQSNDGGRTWRSGSVVANGGQSTLATLPDGSGRAVRIEPDGTLSRRDAQGHWARALLLLNADALHGRPQPTGVTAFTQPLTNAVYLATDGYSVLESTDGGDDWVRAGPGLPDGVLAITTDSSRRAVYAATRDGLWLHHLQATPVPPVYRGEKLTMRILGVIAVCVVAVALGVGAMYYAALRAASGT
jgi:hypothetical protein